MTAAIDLWCGVNESKWNHHPTAPGPLACIAPVYGSSERTRRENPAAVPGDCRVRQDSGAFSDGPAYRLAPSQALQRQLEHAARHKYFYQLESIASYDLLIDEKWDGGRRHKSRWTILEAQAAVTQTVAAAQFLARHRYLIPDHIRLVLSAQGVDADQYLNCVSRIAPFFEDGDILGLGGWCIIGKRPSEMMPVFRRMLHIVLPYVGQGGWVDEIHIWGTLYAPALGELLWMCDQYGLKLSTDSAGPQIRPARGLWGYMGWSDQNYKRPPVSVRGLHRAAHVEAVRQWLAKFRQTEHYREPPLPRERVYYQMQFDLKGA